MLSYVNIKRERLDRIDSDIENAKAHLEMMGAVLHLADQPGWQKYREGIENLMRSKLDQILIMEVDERGIEYLDRRKAELGAEVKLLKQILVAPDKYADQAPKIRATIEALEAEKTSLERQVGTRKE